MKKGRFFLYAVLAVVSVVVAKWIILFLPSNSTPSKSSTPHVSKVDKPKPKEVKEIELSIDLQKIKPQIEAKYQDTINYIDNECIAANIQQQKEDSYYYLSNSEDNFLDWFFGWGTGYKIVWHKIKGMFGSDDNEIQYIQTKFTQSVINPGLDEMYQRVNECVKNALEDYYKDVVMLTKDYINQKINDLKLEGYTSVEINSSTIPWSKYIVAGVGDTYAVVEIGRGVLRLVGAGVASKAATSKVTSLIASKGAFVVSSKAGSIITSKIISGFELVLAPLIDYLANETVKALQYDRAKNDFERIIDDVYDSLKEDLINQAHSQAEIIKDKINNELNRHVKIKAKEIK